MTNANLATDLCLEVARATVRRPIAGGQPLIKAVGEDLADMLAQELASRLAAALPPTLVRSIGDDLLEGADTIAEFVYGDAAEKRKVYHLVQHGRLPTFRLGDKVCARKSTLLSWIKAQEIAGTEIPLQANQAPSEGRDGQKYSTRP
ncbi:hypothetical protein [Azospirillum sp. sgz301742]